MHIHEAIQVVDAVVKYAYNAELDEFAHGVYGREPDDYVIEKYRFMQNNLGGYFGSLDVAHRTAFINAALARQAKNL